MPVSTVAMNDQRFSVDAYLTIPAQALLGGRRAAPTLAGYRHCASRGINDSFSAAGGRLQNFLLTLWALVRTVLARVMRR